MGRHRPDAHVLYRRYYVLLCTTLPTSGLLRKLVDVSRARTCTGTISGRTQFIHKLCLITPIEESFSKAIYHVLDNTGQLLPSCFFQRHERVSFSFTRSCANNARTQGCSRPIAGHLWVFCPIRASYTIEQFALPLILKLVAGASLQSASTSLWGLRWGFPVHPAILNHVRGGISHLNPMPVTAYQLGHQRPTRHCKS